MRGPSGPLGAKPPGNRRRPKAGDLPGRRRTTSKGASLTAGACFWPAAPAAGQKARAPTTGSDGLARDEDDQEREQAALQPVRGDEPETAVNRHQRDRGEAGAGGSAEAAAEQVRLPQRQQAEGDAERERRPFDRQAKRLGGREQERPRQAGRPLDALAEVEDEAVAGGQVAGVAERDEGVVDRADGQEQQRQKRQGRHGRAEESQRPAVGHGADPPSVRPFPDAAVPASLFGPASFAPFQAVSGVAGIAATDAAAAARKNRR